MAEFELLVLGCGGGPREDNLSGYLLAPTDQPSFVALDAGTLLAGLTKVEKLPTSPTQFLRRHVRAYLISHSHLDHIVGLVINGQVEQPKPLLGLRPTLDALRAHIFNGRIWANYGSEGPDALHLYTYHELLAGMPVGIPGSSFQVEAFPLEHAPLMPSTAFLLRHRESYFLYFGDLSAMGSSAERALEAVWQRIAPLVQQGQLKGMVIECSFPKLEDKKGLVGHLDSESLLSQLLKLERLAKRSLKELPVVISHRKEGLDAKGRERICTELEATPLAHFIFPSQGQRIFF